MRESELQTITWDPQTDLELMETTCTGLEADRGGKAPLCAFLSMLEVNWKRRLSSSSLN